MASGIRRDRAAKLIRLWDAGDYDAINFIRANDTVHVAAHADDVPERFKELFGDDAGERMMRLALGEVWTVCGTRLVRHRGGFEQGACLVSHFPDELLCQRCHAAFGDRAALIFEANQNDGNDPTQLGRLANDTVTKGQRPLR